MLDPLALLPLCNLLNLITNLCIQPPPCPPHRDSPKPTVIPSSTAESGSTSKRGQTADLSGFIDRSSWYWESRSGHKTAPAGLAARQQKWFSLKRALERRVKSGAGGKVVPELEQPKWNTVQHLSGERLPQKRSGIISVKSNKEEIVVHIRGTVPHENVIPRFAMLLWSTNLMEARNKGCWLQITLLNDTCQNRVSATVRTQI